MPGHHPPQHKPAVVASRVAKVLERVTQDFMAAELGMPVRQVRRHLRDVRQVGLRDVTALVSVGPSLDLYVAYSYARPLIDAITRRYAAELSVADDEWDLYARETALDVVNVIVGNSTAELAAAGELLTLSPPILMLGARTICGGPGSVFVVLELELDGGTLSIALVGPRHLFDDHLNYNG